MLDDAAVLTTTDTGGAGGGSDAVGGGSGSADDSLLDLGTTTDQGGTDGHQDEGDQGTDGEVRREEDTNRNDDTDRNADRDKEEPELKDYRTTASARLRGMVKIAPKLAEVFKEAPQLQSMIEGIIRRETAMREIFPTVAEARAMREQFPSGQADVQALLEDVREMEDIDKSFDDRGQDGSYPGHEKLIDNFFQRDKEAAVSLFKTFPKKWAQLDRESYNEVMGKVIGATLASREIPEYLSELAEAAKEAEQPALEQGLRKLLGWAQSYTSEKPKPTAEEERLTADRKAFERTRNETQKTEQQRFHSTFVAEARKLQLSTIESHRAVQRLQKVQALSAERKKEIVESIRKEGEQFLAKSTSFMRKLRASYNARNTQDIANLQKAAWSQPWFLNMIVRKVFNKEIPSMVQNNREAAARRTGTPQRSGTPARKLGDTTKQTPKGPRQIGGRWYRENGTAFTTAEVLAGKHLQP